MHWTDVDEIAKSLEEDYPDYDISELSTQDLEELVRSLDDFDDNEVEVNKKVLEEIQEAWMKTRGGELSE